MALVHCSCVQRYGFLGVIFCTYLFEKTERDVLLGDVYMEKYLGGRFFVHTRSVHGGGGAFGGVPLN